MTTAQTSYLLAEKQSDLHPFARLMNYAMRVRVTSGCSEQTRGHEGEFVVGMCDSTQGFRFRLANGKWLNEFDVRLYEGLTFENMRRTASKRRNAIKV